MDRNQYKNYELVQMANANKEDTEYYIVQDNGTYLGSKEVKYVTQVQDVMGVSEDCAVYDLTSQQFYVDVNTSTQFISVSDNELVLSGEATENIYPDGYFLQSIPKNLDVQVSEDNVTNKQNPIENDVDTKETIQTCTEITLDEEQCKILEKNGWILIEFGGKNYMLNKNGLQDVTGNDDLIQQYKDNTKPNVILNTIENNTAAPTTEGTLDTRNIDVIQENDEKFNIKKEQENVLNSVDVHPVTRPETEKKDTTTATNDIKKITASVSKNSDHTSMIYTRLKTNMALKDLPYKMKLGKTGRKRRLIARIESIDYTNGKREKKSVKYDIELKPDIPKNTPGLESLLGWARVGPAAGDGGCVSCTAEDVSVAEVLVAKLLSLPGSRDMLVERHVVITKICRLVSKMLPEGEEARNRLVLVAGRVRQFQPGGDWHLDHSPHMLTNLLTNCDIEDEPARAGGKMVDRWLLHVHVAADETTDGYAAVSLVKRRLPLKMDGLKTPVYACSACAVMFKTNEQLVTHQTDCLLKHKTKSTSNDSTSTSDASNCEGANMKHKKKKQLHACSACATVFKIEKDLKEHQKIYNSQCCKDVNTETGVANDKSDKINEDQNATEYLCMYCKKRFSRMANYRKHVSIHTKSKIENCLNKDTETVEASSPTKDKEVHKCNICSSVYYHAATLTKHIKMDHINIVEKIKKE